MLRIILSHWIIYLYASWVIVLIVLCVAFPPRLRVIGRRLSEFHTRRKLMRANLRMRQLR